MKVVGACTPCQEAQPRQQKEPLQPQEIPTTPWTIKLGTDLFELDGENFLLIVDYHSKYPVVHKMTSTTSASVAQATAATFGLLGVPVEILSDNGPQFAGAAYNDMCAKWSVTHTTASPRYPRSNGQAERMVRTVKSMLKKCRRTGQDAHMALLHLRATPIDANLPAPAEILFGRPVRTTLPSNNPYDKLQAQADNNEHLQTRRDDMKRNHDQQAGPPLPPLYVGQKVRALDTPSKSWIRVRLPRSAKSHGLMRLGHQMVAHYGATGRTCVKCMTRAAMNACQAHLPASHSQSASNLTTPPSMFDSQSCQMSEVIARPCQRTCLKSLKQTWHIGTNRPRLRTMPTLCNLLRQLDQVESAANQLDTKMIRA